MKDLRPETIAAQAGGAIDEATGAVVPPIHIATTYIRDPDNQYRRGFGYSRPDNPVVRQAEDVLRQLEGGEACLMFGSGMAAATTAFLALERPAHVVAPNVMYWSLRNWLATDAPGLGVRATFVDATSVEAIREATIPGETRMVWIETPSNPLWGISDIRGVRRDRACGRRAARRQLDRGNAGAHAAARPRRRCRHALGDEVPEWPLRRDCRRAGISPGRTPISSGRHACATCSARSSGRSRHRCCCAACARCTCGSGIRRPRRWPSHAIWPATRGCSR